MAEQNLNWAGNISYKSTKVLRPTTVSELQSLVAGAATVRPLGTRHSFNDIADTPGIQITVDGLDRPVVIDPVGQTVTVGAGVRYGILSAQLQAAGWALPNLGSLPHISVGGACATGTHGSGSRNRNLPSALSAIEFVAADGELVTLSRAGDPERFAGAAIGLGALGVLTSVTLDIVATYDVAQQVFLELDYDLVDAHFDAIAGSAYSVSLFDDYRSDSFNYFWCKARVGDSSVPQALPFLDDAWFTEHAAPVEQHPVPAQDAATATAQLGVVGPWNQRLPHFRLESVPSAGAELQTEYLLPREHAVAALQSLRPLKALIAPLLMISEVRTVAADDLWLSAANGRDVVALHFTWYRNWPPVREVLVLIEAALRPFDARPHWGKLFVTSPARLHELFGRLSDFAALAADYDPAGKFRNGFLERVL